MGTQKEIRTRITSVQKTQKITSAMKVVSAAKLARAQQAISAARPYAEKLRDVLGSVASGVEADAHPLLVRRESVRKLDLVLFSSDRGLCGGFNSNVIKFAESQVAERGEALVETRVIPVGRRGGDYFRRRGHEFPAQYTGLATPTPEDAAGIARLAMQRYRAGETDEVVLVYSEFGSAVRQTPRAETLLPFAAGESADSAGGGYEIEPDAETLLALLLPRAVEFGIFRALLESAASEHGARMSAMDAATNNCQELVESLTLDMNKARQAAITQELSEIVGGAEAL